MSGTFLDIAEADLRTAQISLKENDEYMTKIAAFHLEQSVEKALKHCYSHFEKDVPQTSDISALLKGLFDISSYFPVTLWEELEMSADTLTVWEEKTRYSQKYIATRASVKRTITIVEELLRVVANLCSDERKNELTLLSGPAFKRSFNSLNEEAQNEIMDQAEKLVAEGRDDAEWLNQHIPYILNCIGPTKEMLEWYLLHNLGGNKPCDVSSFVGGLPCELRVCPFERRAPLSDEISGNRFVITFILVLTRDLSPEEQGAWKKLPYGILLADNRRLLVKDIRELEVNVSQFKLASALSRGGGRVKDTPERQRMVALYENEAQGGKSAPVESSSAADSKSGPKKMDLFGKTKR